MEHFLINFKNKIDFFIRKNLKFSRKNYFEENESKDDILKSLEIAKREAFLFEKYDLLNLKYNSTMQNYLENLYALDLLDEHLNIEFRNEISILDIGCKNCFYARGLYYFFKKYCNKFSFTGIEIDFNRLYSNLFSRYEVAKFHTKDIINAKLIQDDLLKHNEKYDYITWFLPFVFEYPHLKWGLPLKHFSPEKMLSHAYCLLNEGGVIFVINQGIDEYNRQKQLCELLNIPYVDVGEINSIFIEYDFKYYLTLIKK